MPWFITAIATEKNSIENPSLEWKTKRTFGFYNTYNEAYCAIAENRYNIRECLYDHIVMEYIEPGIHPPVRITCWWQWDKISKVWMFLSKDKFPKEFDSICNWALG